MLGLVVEANKGAHCLLLRAPKVCRDGENRYGLLREARLVRASRNNLVSFKKSYKRYSAWRYCGTPAGASANLLELSWSFLIEK